MKVLVTGGAGFIGSHLVEALVKRGDAVRVLDNFSSGKLEFLNSVRKSIQLVRGDVTQPADCAKAARGVRVVFHLAARRSVIKSVLDPVKTHAADATGTLLMLQASKEARVDRFVYASSSSVYGIARKFPMREEDPLRPVSPYGAAKLAGEFYAYSYFMTYRLPAVSLRFFNVYGPRQNPESAYSQAVPGIVYRLRRGLRPVIHGDGRQSRDFTYVGDAVKAILSASRAPDAAGCVFNIACGKDYSILHLHKILARVMSKSHWAPVFKPRRPSDPDRTLADVSKAQKILGWKPAVPLQAGLASTVEWFEGRS